MAITPGTEQILAAAATWRDRCLIQDRSLFSDNAIWTSSHLDELQRHFVENLDMGEGTFFEKLEEQLAATTPGAKQLAAEMLCVMLLFPTNVGRATKAGQVARVWSWSGSALDANHPLLTTPLERGIGNTGRAFLNRRWAELVFFVVFLRRWKDKSADARAALLRDPWEFGSFLDRTPGADGPQLRHILLHLLFPETFERIASRAHREAIDEHFSEQLGLVRDRQETPDSEMLALDRRLQTIREALAPDFPPGAAFDFYSSSIKRQWFPEDDGDPPVTPEPPPAARLSLSRSLETILGGYLRARTTEPFGANHSLAMAFRNAEQALTTFDEVRSRRTLRIRASAGQGNWANVPWIALLDSRETTSTQSGVYCVFLFRQDMTGVYLTFNQGVTKPLRELGRPGAVRLLAEQARQLRSEGQALHRRGFLLDDGIDLHAEGGIGGHYEVSTIAYKFYEAGQVPSDDLLRADLAAVLEGYDAYLDRSASPPFTKLRSWIFQSNPELFDLRRALTALPELTWLVKQHIQDIRVGDRVYLWQSGPEAGIVATASVIGPAEDRELGRREAPFVLTPEKFNGTQKRALLRIDRQLLTPIARQELLDIPGLRELSILRAPQGTNFQVSSVEADIIERLLARADLPPEIPPRPDLAAVHSSFGQSLVSSNVSFGSRHDDVVRAFVASLAAKRFVILTGLSGSGKTQIALRFGEWCGPGQFLLVPVRPDWTGAEALFGYEDALLPVVDGRRAWHVPDALAFMLKAAADPGRPYVLILDEMNLAHVERYFADVLSGMESDVPCLPYLELEGGLWYPAAGELTRVRVPDNLFVVGTVNVDETTYMFSPKVLDRANTLEFRVESTELSVDSKKPTPSEAGPEDLVRGFLLIARDEAFHLSRPHPHQSEIRDALVRLHSLLSEGGFEFGHRVFFEAIRFSAMHAASGGERWEDALDLQVLQKIMPRLHGSRRRLEPTLNALGRFCVDLVFEPGSVVAPASGAFDPLQPPDQSPRLPRAFDKVRRMSRSLRANQFASFAE